MRRIVTLIVSAAVAFAIASPTYAGAPPKKEEKEKPVPGVFRLPKHVEVTADQQAKIDALVAKYLPRLRELEEKADSVFTAEQKQARDAARKAAHAEGIHGKEANERVEAAVKLTEEQAAKRAELEQAKKKLEEEIRAEVMSLLTPEQKNAIAKPEKKGPPPGKPHGPKEEGKGPKPEKKGPPHGKPHGPKDKD